MVSSDVDWVSVLVQTLDSSPLLLADTFSKRPSRSNAWQCHILACMLTCLVPRIRAEVVDFHICNSHGGLEQDVCGSVQVAAQDVCHAVRHAESFLQACQMDDPVSLIVSTACTSEALTVHMHNIFWSVSGFLLATRLAIAFSDDKLSAIIEHQLHCWSHIISRYMSLGAEALDHRDLASAALPDFGMPASMGEPQAFSVTKILSSRLRWLVSRDRTREQQADMLLEDLKIDFEELQLSNMSLLDEQDEERKSFARARWAGIPVSVLLCRRDCLKEHATMLLRMKHPFLIQLIGWTEAPDDKGLTCFLLMEDGERDLEDLIREKTETSTSVDKQKDFLFPFSVALDMMLQIARGMWYLHGNGIAHRCLQSRNVLVCTRNVDGAGHLKLCPGRLFPRAETPSLLDFATDVHCFGMLCREMLTGTKYIANADGPEDFQVPEGTPLLLVDCLKACCDLKPQSRPEFGVICGLLKHFKLIISHPLRLERLLYLNEAAKASSKPPLTNTISLPSKGADKAGPDEMSLRIQLIDINVHFLHASTPRDMYPHVATESWLGKPLVSMSALLGMSSNLEKIAQTSHDQDISSSTNEAKFIIANAGALTTSMVADGYQGLLKSGWTCTILGVGTLEMWLKYLSPAWDDIQKVALGMALCLRHVSKTPPKLGLYSQEGGDIDGFYPLHPGNIFLNSQLKVALLLDNSPPAWKSLIQWVGIHPEVGPENNVISIEAYTTFYFGHLLSAVLKVCLSKADKSVTGSLDHHFEFVLTNLAMRCIQMKYLSMTEVVTILLGDHKLVQNH